jgi:hypothetical protein
MKRPESTVLLCACTWLLSLVASEAIALEQGLSGVDSLRALLTFATPQAVLLLLLKLFRVRAHVLFGAAIALAAQLALALWRCFLYLYWSIR